MGGNRTNPDSPPRLLKLDEAAERLAISRRTLQTLIAQGALPAVRVSPRRLALDPGDIDRYIAQQRR